MKEANMNKKLIGMFTAMITLALVVSSLPGFAQGSTTKPLGVTVLNEGFEAGAMPPAGWQKIAQYTSYSWQIATDQKHTGIYSAKVPSRGGTTAQDEKLISPLIDLTGTYDYATLDFWCYTKLPTSTEYPYATVKLYLDKKGDGFQEDEVIWSLVNEPTADWSTNAWREKHIDLTPYIGSIISLQWRFVEQSGHMTALNAFYLDDVTVSVPELTPKTMINIKQIGYGSRVSATINNTGNFSAENIDWKITVTGGILGKINVVSNGTIAKLKRNGDDHEDTATVSSGSFRGFGMVNITVTASTKDANPKTVSRSAKGFVILSKCYPMVRLMSNQPYLD